MESTHGEDEAVSSDPPVPTVSNLHRSKSVRLTQKPSTPFFSSLQRSNAFSSGLDEADDGEQHFKSIPDNIENALISFSSEGKEYDEDTPYDTRKLSYSGFQEYGAKTEQSIQGLRKGTHVSPKRLIAWKDNDPDKHEEESVRDSYRQECTLCRPRSVRGSRPTWPLSHLNESFGVQPRSDMADDRRLCDSKQMGDENKLGNTPTTKVANRRLHLGISKVPTQYNTTVTSSYQQRENINKIDNCYPFYECTFHEEKQTPLPLKKHQQRGLQRSLNMLETSRFQVVDRSNSKMSPVSDISNSPMYNSKPLVNKRSMFSNYVKRTANIFCLDSDSPIASERPRFHDSTVSPQQLEPSQETMMEVPKNNVGVWKFGEDNFFTTVSKVWSVSDCIAHVRNKIGRFGYGDLDLWIKNRCIMLDKMKSLSDYPGLKSLHVIRRPSSRDPHPLHQTSRSDDTDPFSDDTCVAMPCGHAISPENLYQYAWKKIQNGGVEVTCPAVPDVNKPGEQCSKTWDFQSISKLACLSNDENNLFCSKLFSNVLEREANIYLCPVCNEAIFSSCKSVFKCFNCENSGASFSFCVMCNRTTYDDICYNSECQESLPKIRALLRDCRTRTLVDVPNCPSVRACPVCKCVIEYDEGESCKHMTCPRNSCQTKFCFICLKVKTDKYYWPCGGAYEPCTPSPRQII